VDKVATAPALARDMIRDARETRGDDDDGEGDDDGSDDDSARAR
jgi:hypothetical protein